MFGNVRPLRRHTSVLWLRFLIPSAISFLLCLSVDHPICSRPEARDGNNKQEFTFPVVFSLTIMFSCGLDSEIVDFLCNFSFLRLEFQPA